MYSVLIADPPWSFGDSLGGTKGIPCPMGHMGIVRGASAKYATMPTPDIASIPVRNWVADDAILALWVPCSLLADGMQVMAAWGFTQKQVYVWVKRNVSGKLACGMGRQFRSCKEIALIGTRGRPVPAVRNERDVFEAPNAGHSIKPESLHASLARMYPAGGKLELFARRAVLGWTCVGLECEGGVKADLREWVPETEGV